MRIFLASTHGLDAERDAVQVIAERLNKRHKVAPGSRYHLEVVDWSRHLAPLLSSTQSVVLQKAPATSWDVFVGLGWLRFSPPISGKIKPREGFIASSERDFELAYRFWSRLEMAQGFFYRSMRLPESLAEIDGLELDRVARFFSRFHPGEEGPFHYREITAAAELESHLEAELVKAMRRLHDSSKRAAPAPAEDVDSAEDAETPAAERDDVTGMVPGEAYAVSFLSMEIAGHEELAAKHQAKPEALLGLEESFRELVRSTAAGYGGSPFTWRADGGLMVFRGKRARDQAIMSGLKVLHNLPVFNLDPQQNPLSAAIEVRAAVNDANILFASPPSEVSSPDLDFLRSLQKELTSPGELCIAKRLLEKIDERLSSRFKPKGRFEGEPIAACRLPTSSRDTRAANVEELVGRVKHQASLIETFLGAPGSPLELASAESIGAITDEVYALLNKFCLGFSSIDDSWTREQLGQLADAAALLRHVEGGLWKRLRKHYSEGRTASSAKAKLEAMVQAASRRRSRPVVILEKLEERCRMLVAGESDKPSAPVPAGAVDLVRKIDHFIRADALDVETALTDLLLNHKGAFLEYLEGQKGEKRHRRLLDKLWETADLVLLDDLCSLRGHQRAGEAKVFGALAAEAVGDGRFRVVEALLASTEKLETAAIEERFRSGAGREPTEDDLQVIWRSIVLGHTDDGARSRAAFRLTLHSLWQAVSHPSIPLSSIYAIGERVAKNEGEDAQKIFFDCIRGRLDDAVEGFASRSELSVLTNLVLLLLDFPFLVETGYFERFDDILGKFLARAQKAGMRLEYFENIRKKLESARLESDDKSPSKLPSGIKSLPLTIQRRLAGEARYLYWFVSHPDPRIAGETLKHVTLSNAERVLRVREVNGAVMSSLLRRPEFFTRSQPLLAALNHPKCDQTFASKYVPGLARSRGGVQALEKISRNPSANPVVRSLAQRAVAGRSKMARR